MQGKPERASDFADELVRLKVDLIVAVSNPATLAAKNATTTIPIVMAGVADPVGAGLVASLARPEGNITGVADYPLDLIPKRLEQLKAALPSASRVAFVRCLKCQALDPPATETARKSAWEAAPQKLGITLAYIDLSGPQDLEAATAAVPRTRPEAVFLAPNPVNFFLRKELADFAMRERLPMFAFAREQAAVGALIAYGLSFPHLFRKTAVYVGKILKGAKAADLPVEQPTKFELVINLKTAKALGLTIPQSLLLRADEVIE
jgi:putative ABC transport system substrate-binding protein